MIGRLLCRFGIHSTYPQQSGRWYVNGRCTRCGVDLRAALSDPTTPDQTGGE